MNPIITGETSTSFETSVILVQVIEIGQWNF